MQLNQAILFLTISLFFFQAEGQKLDKTFYLLGTLNDYMGRSYTKNNPKQWGYVIILHQSRITQIKRIEEITGAKFTKGKKRKDCRNCQEFYHLKSIVKAKRLNHFYKFEQGTWTDNFGFRFYTGALICDKLTNTVESNQLSFIAGLFLTCGTKDGEIYKITLFNSPDKFECAKQILLRLGAEITSEDVRKNTIPCLYSLSFKPSDKLKTVIETEIKARGYATKP